MGDQSRAFAAKGIPRENLGPRVDTLRSFLGRTRSSKFMAALVFTKWWSRLNMHAKISSRLSWIGSGTLFSAARDDLDLVPPFRSNPI